MFSPDDFFTILQFYDDNKDVIGSDTSTSDDLVYNDETSHIDTSVIQTAVDNKIKTTNLFKNVFDQVAFNSDDYNRLRRLLIDWHATNRTFIELSGNSSDPFSMTLELLHEAIRSFGFDYSTLISDKTTRALFLLSLVDLYKKKGSPQALVDALKFFGFSNVGLYEWWLVRIGDNIFFEGRLLDTGDQLDSYPRRRLVSWERFTEIEDPHWYYEESQVVNIDLDPNTFIGLPSITPYFSLSSALDFGAINSAYAVLARLLSDQYDNFLTTENQPPQDQLIDSGGFRVSLLALHLGILYAYWNYSGWIKYQSLYSYVSREFNIVPEEDYVPFIYSTPYAYEKLLYWLSVREDEFGNHQPLDIFAFNNPNALQPFTGTPFAPFPVQMEYYTATNAPDLSGGIDDTNLDYDISVLNHDDGVWFPELNNLPFFTVLLRYIHVNTENITNYDKNVLEIIQYPQETATAADEYNAAVATRPTTRAELKQNWTNYKTNFTRPERLNYTLNQIDPGRILQGIPPVNTVGDLPTTANIGDSILVRSNPSGDPAVYEWTGVSWIEVPEGLNSKNLGLDNDFKEWIDSQVTTPDDYIDVVSNLLSELDIFVSTYIVRTQIRLARILLGVDIITELDPVIDFFKPKRARFFAYDIIYLLDQPLEHTIVIEDEMELGAITLEVPESGPETVRGRIPEDYDEYSLAHDDQNIFDDITIEVYEDDGFGNLVLVSEDDWLP